MKMKSITLLIALLFITLIIFYGCENTNIGDNLSENNNIQSTESPEDNIIVQNVSTRISDMTMDIPTEMISNGNFSNEHDGWNIYTEDALCELVDSEEDALLKIDNTGDTEHAVQLLQNEITLKKGISYTLEFDASSTTLRTGIVSLQKSSDPYTQYFQSDIKITEESSTFTMDFIMDYPTDTSCTLTFLLGKTDDSSLETHEIRIDNVSLKKTDDVQIPFVLSKLDVENNIRINQVGYKPSDVKIAAFANIDTEISEFKIVSDTSEVVLIGSMGEPYENPISGEIIRLGDFSMLSESGRYHIEVDGYESSYDFDISPTVYDELSSAVMKMFYYQRCSMDLTSDLVGDFAHGACHTNEAEIIDSGIMKDVTGGWHDAGDFGRYITPGSKAVIDLMLSYERNPSIYSDNNGIAESGNSIPDILDEVRYELDMFLKMQDTSTGGVYHKVSTATFTYDHMPDEITEKQYISPVSAMATADFAAVMAKASRMYREIDEDFADTCIERALLAWKWLEDNPDAHGFQNPSNISTGEYGDSSSNDERFWAAAELYSITKDEKYHDYLKNNEIETGMSWASMGLYGVFAYLKLPEEMQDKALYTEMKETLISTADDIVLDSRKDMYQTTLHKSQYVWGSNGIVADNAMLLLIANDCENNSIYVDTAFEQLNYLLGKNALGISYITGFGTNAAERPHHRIVQTVGKAFPGLVVGGPNFDKEDSYAKYELANRPHAQCYADSESSFSTNEIAIYWNSPLVYLVNYFK